MPGHSVGTVNSTTSQLYLYTNGVGITTKTYSTVAEMFEGFYANEVDALLYDYPILVFNLNERKRTNGSVDAKIVGKIFEKQSYGIAIREGNAELQEQLNLAILNVWQSDTYIKIFEKWFTFSNDAEVSEDDFSISFLFLGGIGGLFIGLLILIYCYYKLDECITIYRQTNKNISDSIKTSIGKENSWKRKIELLHEDIEDDRFLSETGIRHKTFDVTRDIQEMIYQLKELHIH